MEFHWYKKGQNQRSYLPRSSIKTKQYKLHSTIYERHDKFCELKSLKITNQMTHGMPARTNYIMFIMGKTAFYKPDRK